MIKSIRKILVSLAASTALLVPLAVPVAVHAQTILTEPNINSSLCQGSNIEIGNDTCDAQGAEDKVNNLIAFIINVFSIIVGVVSVIMIIVGGLKYITSGGDSGNITGAKNTILYAIIGLAVVGIAQFVVHFVLTRTATL